MHVRSLCVVCVCMCVFVALWKLRERRREGSRPLLANAASNFPKILTSAGLTLSPYEGDMHAFSDSLRNIRLRLEDLSRRNATCP